MHLPRHALLVLLLAPAVAGGGSLDNARAAQALLGPGFWSRVLEIENDSAESKYPHTVYALVFALDGALWFYTDTDGTQSLSEYRGRLRQDEENLGPLLRGIDPGFKRWSAAPEGPRGARQAGSLPNGCFIESVSALRRLLLSRAAPADPRLLLYYVRTAAGVRGHAVLEFTDGAGVEVIDPLSPTRAVRMGMPRAATPKAVAARIRSDVVEARWVPLGEVALSRPPALAGPDAGRPGRS